MIFHYINSSILTSFVNFVMLYNLSWFGKFLIWYIFFHSCHMHWFVLRALFLKDLFKKKKKLVCVSKQQCDNGNKVTQRSEKWLKLIRKCSALKHKEHLKKGLSTLQKSLTRLIFFLKVISFVYCHWAHAQLDQIHIHECRTSNICGL